MQIPKTLRILGIGLLFLIPIFPLIVANSYFFPFITGKAFYFRIIVELVFAVWVILAFYDAKYRPRLSPLTIAVTLFTGVTLIAALLGVNPIRSIVSNFERMEGWLAIAHLWMFYMASVHIFGHGEEGKRWWHRWFNFSLVIASITAIYALVQLAGGAAIHQGSSRIDASLGNAAYLAVYMLMHTGIAVYLAFVARIRAIAGGEFLQYVYPVLAVIFGFIVFQTQTRGTILGLIGGILVALTLYAIFAKKENNKSRAIAGGVIGFVILAGIVFWSNRPSVFIEKNLPLNSLAKIIDGNQTLNRLATISWNDTKTQARGYVWPMAIEGFKERPLFGWGQENFNYIFNTNYHPKMWGQEQWFDRAHSVFLDWLVASGGVGFLSYLSLYILALFVLWRSHLTIGEKSALTGLVVGYAIHNVFVFDNIASYVSFFAMLGFIGSIMPYSHSKKSAHVSKVDAWLEKTTVSHDAVEYIVAPVVIVALVAGLYFLNVRPIQANTRLISALTACANNRAGVDLFAKALEVDSYMANQEIREQIISCSSNVIQSQTYQPATKQEFYGFVSQQIQAQITATPLDARAYILGGSFFVNAGQIAEAKPLLEKARELSPKKQSVAFQLATVYLQEDKKDEAIALLKDAYESDPSYEDARGAYITGLILVGKEAEARKIFTDPSLFETERVARAYASNKQYDKAIAIYKKLITADQKNVQVRSMLAQIQYTAGKKWEAVETLKTIVKDFPEYKTQVESAIKEIQATP